MDLLEEYKELIHDPEPPRETEEEMASRIIRNVFNLTSPTFSERLEPIMPHPYPPPSPVQRGTMMTVDRQGFLITYNSRGEEVIRINSDGIFINGRLTMGVDIDGPIRSI